MTWSSNPARVNKHEACGTDGTDNDGDAREEVAEPDCALPRDRAWTADDYFGRTATHVS